MTFTQTPPVAPVVEPAPDGVWPLQPEDPPRLGEFWLRGRLSANSAGYLYAGEDETGRAGVVVLMAEGAADDAGARDRFHRGLESLPAESVLARNTPDDDDVALWAAIGPIEDDGSSGAADSRRLAERRGGEVLSAVLMDRIPHIGRFRGPDFLHYWEGRRRPGLFRLWPLPWPGALRPASWLAMAMTMVAMLFLMGAALLIAWLLFKDQPEVDPGPPIPTTTVTVTPTDGQSSGAPTTGPGTSPTRGPSTGTSTVPIPTGSGRPTTLPTNPNSSGPVDPDDRF